MANCQFRLAAVLLSMLAMSKDTSACTCSEFKDGVDGVPVSQVIQYSNKAHDHQENYIIQGDCVLQVEVGLSNGVTSIKPIKTSPNPNPQPLSGFIEFIKPDGTPDAKLMIKSYVFQDEAQTNSVMAKENPTSEKLKEDYSGTLFVEDDKKTRKICRQHLSAVAAPSTTSRKFYCRPVEDADGNSKLVLPQGPQTNYWVGNVYNHWTVDLTVATGPTLVNENNNGQKIDPIGVNNGISNAAAFLDLNHHEPKLFPEEDMLVFLKAGGTRSVAYRNPDSNFNVPANKGYKTKGIAFLEC